MLDRIEEAVIYQVRTRAFFDSLKKYGFSSAFKSTLSDAGFKIYSKKKFPSKDFEIRVRSHWSWDLLEEGRWEYECVKHFYDVVKVGSVIIDVGAWQGPYTILFSKLTGDEGRVISFEPDPRAREILSDNIRANDIKNAKIESYVLSNEPGKITLNSQWFGDSGSTIMKHLDKGNVRKVLVDAITLDQYCEDKKIHPQGIKVDVEGAEGLVIEGAQKIIRKNAPWLMLEFHGQFMSDNERVKIWHDITRGAIKMHYIDGESKTLRYGDELRSFPDCLSFHVFIQY